MELTEKQKKNITISGLPKPLCPFFNKCPKGIPERIAGLLGL